MPSVSTLVNGVRQKLAGRALMDVAFSNSSTNGVQNKVIKAKFDEIEGMLNGDNVIAEVTSDGVKTRTQLLNELYTLAMTHLVGNEKLLLYVNTWTALCSWNGTVITASISNISIDSTFANIDVYCLNSSNSSRNRASFTFSTNTISFDDQSSVVDGVGVIKYRIAKFN